MEESRKKIINEFFSWLLGFLIEFEFLGALASWRFSLFVIP